MNTSIHVTRICCWLILSASAASLGAAEFTTDLPIATPFVIAYSPSGEQIAVGGLAPEQNSPADGVVVLIDTATRKLQSLLRHSAETEHGRTMNPVGGLSYSPDGHTLAVATYRGLKLWDPSKGVELAKQFGNRQWRGVLYQSSVAFSPDGKLLAASGDGWRLRLWDVAQGKLIREIEIGRGFHSAWAFSPNSKLLVTAGENGHVALWQVSDGKQMAESIASRGQLHAVAFDPRGERIAAIGFGRGVFLRVESTDSGGWRLIDDGAFSEQSATPPISGVSFSPDGRLLVACGSNDVLVIYDVQTRQLAGTLLAGPPFRFAPDGKSLAVAHRQLSKLVGPGQDDKTRVAIWTMAELLDVDRLAERARAAAADLVTDLSAPQEDQNDKRSVDTASEMLTHAPVPGSARAMVYLRVNAVLTVIAGPQGQAATSMLVDSLKSPSVSDKRPLLWLLRLVANRDPQARTAIIEALRTAKAVDVRTAAATMLVCLSADSRQEAIPALVEAAVNDESPDVRATAEVTLKKLDPNAYEQVAKQIQARGPVVDRVERRDGKPFYQGRSLKEWIERLSVSYMPNEIGGRPLPDEPLAALRAIGPDAVPLLLETLKRKEQPLRRAAAAGFGALGPQAESAMEPLLNIISDADAADVSFVAGVPGGVASEAADSLALILKDRQEPPARLVKLTSSDNPAARLSAARTVAIMAPAHPRGLPVLKVAKAAVDSLAIGPSFVPYAWLFGEHPNVNWLGRVLADDEAPAAYRTQTANCLEQMAHNALPALPSMLKAIATADPSLSHNTIRAIHKIGPQAVLAVRDALQSTSDNRTRARLAAALWGLGDEGRTAAKEVLRGDSVEVESLWWAAFAGTWDGEVAWKYQKAVWEAIQRTGQIDAAQPPPDPMWRLLKRQPPSASPPRPRPPMPVAFQPPGAAWSVKVLADQEAPPLVRNQAARELSSTPRSELAPHVSVLVQGLASETESGMVPHFAGLLQRIGPEVIPLLKTAFEQAQSDQARRHLLIVLSARFGAEGRQAFDELRQRHPECRQLFETHWQSNAPSATPDRASTCLLTIRVQVPETTPVQDLLYVTGNDAAFGNWNPKGLQLVRRASGEYEAQVRLKKGSRVEYKITRGSWETVEKGSNKEELSNRVLTASSDQTIAIRVENWRDQLERQQVEPAAASSARGTP